uniref:tetratricopeptide repeat protein n=1 Tax=Parerythrobacter lutipelagi TaxID=1964208 RepID=UPI0010F95732|nr:tetratricopeptide repeat protein [Parerythrobacter lutipelagi]
MTWIPILALALIVFLVAAFLLRLPRAGWALFGAALMFGLAGYALQGSPQMAASPKSQVAEINESNFAFIEARREFFGVDQLPAQYIVMSDGYARRGEFVDAAALLRGAVVENPQDAEAWVALGNALLEHADGNLTPAALFAYSRAELAEPGNPAATYFYGVGLLQAGQPMQTRAIWADLVENAPEDAPWRDNLAAQLERLDNLIAQGGM